MNYTSVSEVMALIKQGKMLSELGNMLAALHECYIILGKLFSELGNRLAALHEWHTMRPHNERAEDRNKERCL